MAFPVRTVWDSSGRRCVPQWQWADEQQSVTEPSQQRFDEDSYHIADHIDPQAGHYHTNFEGGYLAAAGVHRWYCLRSSPGSAGQPWREDIPGTKFAVKLKRKKDLVKFYSIRIDRLKRKHFKMQLLRLPLHFSMNILYIFYRSLQRIYCNMLVMIDFKL